MSCHERHDLGLAKGVFLHCTFPVTNYTIKSEGRPPPAPPLAEIPPGHAVAGSADACIDALHFDQAGAGSIEPGP